MSPIESAIGILENSQIGQKGMDTWIFAEEVAGRICKGIGSAREIVAELIGNCTPDIAKRGYANVAGACEDLATAVGYRAIGLEGKTE